MKNRIILFFTFSFTFFSMIILFKSFNIIPLVLKKDTFVYEYGQSTISTDVSDYIIANDFITSEAKLILDDVGSDVGIYIAKISYLSKEYPFFIKIVDTINPIAALKEVEIFVEIGSTVVALDLVEIIEEYSKSIVYFSENNVYEEERVYLSAGTFIENIVVVDSSNNASSNLRVKISVGKKSHYPLIIGEDVIIEIDSLFNPYLDINAEDGLGININSKINILKNTVDTSKKGEYEVIYSVTNTEGNTTQLTRKVTVE